MKGKVFKRHLCIGVVIVKEVHATCQTSNSRNIAQFR